MKGYGPNKRYATELEKNRNEEEDCSKILEENAEDDIAPAKESFEFEVRKYKSKRKQELKVEQEAALKQVKLNGKTLKKGVKAKDMGKEAKRIYVGLLFFVRFEGCIFINMASNGRSFDQT